MVIFLFGLEDLFTRDSRAQMCTVSSLPQTVGCCWLSWQSNQLLLVPTAIKPVYNSLLSTVWALGKYCFVNLSSSTISCTDFLDNVCPLAGWLEVSKLLVCGQVRGAAVGTEADGPQLGVSGQTAGEAAWWPSGQFPPATLRFNPNSIMRRSSVTCSVG